MSERDNDLATAHKDGGEPYLQELEEPETLDVVIDGTSPSDYPDEEKRKQWRPRVLLSASALLVVSVALGVSLGLTAKKESPPAQSPSPSSSPTSPPTLSSAAPISVSPTQSPSSSPTSSVVNEFLNGLPSYSLELISNDAISPQARALDWLQKDPLYNEYEQYRLYQRYALAVLFYSTNGTLWSGNRGWLSDDNECTWYQYDDAYGSQDDITCTEASRLSVVSFFLNDLDGTIPTELELLTDLEYMRLNDDSLSGKIHSEL
jgi:hypothetical protein